MHIAKKLQVIWICVLISTALRYVTVLLQIVVPLYYVILIVQYIMVFQMWRESPRFEWALGFYLAGIAQILFSIAVIPIYLVLGALYLISGFIDFIRGDFHISRNSSNSGESFFSSFNFVQTIFAWLQVLFTLVANYHFIWALDERITTHGYCYPKKRIRWCFFALLIDTVLLLMPDMRATQTGTAVSLLCNGVYLVLFFQYIQAVKAAEKACPQLPKPERHESSNIPPPLPPDLRVLLPKNKKQD